MQALPFPPHLQSALWALSVLLALLVLAVGVFGPQAARAAGLLSWSPPQPIEQGGVADLAHVSCPSTSLCVAVDAFYGDVVTSTNPTGGASAWTATNIDSRNGNPGSALNGVSCPSSSLCVAVDGSGKVLTTSNPTGGASAWTTTHVDPESSGFSAVSCPTTSLCVAVDSSGNVVTSSDPTGGAAAWTAAAIDTTFIPETGTTTTEPLTGVSCPSAELCVAIDAKGQVLTSTNPTGGASAWTRVRQVLSASLPTM
jgi:hypothetical protein